MFGGGPPTVLARGPAVRGRPPSPLSAGRATSAGAGEAAGPMRTARGCGPLPVPPGHPPPWPPVSRPPLGTQEARPCPPPAAVIHRGVPAAEGVRGCASHAGRRCPMAPAMVLARAGHRETGHRETGRRETGRRETRRLAPGAVEGRRHAGMGDERAGVTTGTAVLGRVADTRRHGGHWGLCATPRRGPWTSFPRSRRRRSCVPACRAAVPHRHSC